MLKKLLGVIGGIILALALLLAALLVWPLPEMPRQGIAGDFLISNVAVVDVEAGILREHQNVVILDGRIASVRSAETPRVQESLIGIDGTGKYLMPGLWDMHTHSLKISPQYHHPLFIANGVTGAREMSGCMSEPDSFLACFDDLERWSNAIRDKRAISPRYVLWGSAQINGGDTVPDRMPGFFKARNAGEARELVAFYAEAGADSLKTYSNLSPAAYRALADGAHEHKIPYLFEKATWMPDADRAVATAADDSGRNVYAHMYQMALRDVGQAHMAGVKLLAGTDAGDTYVFPGFSIHDELVELVSAGLAPADALRSATIDAALFSGKESDFGSIDAGKVADMILLNADPLADIRNTQRIEGLFFNGQYFDRAALDQLLEFAELQAGSIRTNLHLLWDAVNSPIVRMQLAD